MFVRSLFSLKKSLFENLASFFNYEFRSIERNCRIAQRLCRIVPLLRPGIYHIERGDSFKGHPIRRGILFL